MPCLASTVVGGRYRKAFNILRNTCIKLSLRTLPRRTEKSIFPFLLIQRYPLNTPSHKLGKNNLRKAFPALSLRSRSYQPSHPTNLKWQRWIKPLFNCCPRRNFIFSCCPRRNVQRPQMEEHPIDSRSPVSLLELDRCRSSKTGNAIEASPPVLFCGVPIDVCLEHATPESRDARLLLRGFSCLVNEIKSETNGTKKQRLHYGLLKRLNEATQEKNFNVYVRALQPQLSAKRNRKKFERMLTFRRYGEPAICPEGFTDMTLVPENARFELFQLPACENLVALNQFYLYCDAIK